MMEEEKDRQQCCGSDPDADRVGFALFFRIWVGINARHMEKCTRFTFPTKFSYAVQNALQKLGSVADPGSEIRDLVPF